MKLFQRLLVAPAALGLMAPVAVNADTAFSSSTTLSGGATFTVGSVDAGTGEANEEMYMQYAYGLDMTTSFTGEDSLYVGLETGNASGPLASMDSATTGGGTIALHSLFYSFPIGDLSLTAGPLVDQDDVVAATTAAYSDAFRLGAMPYSLAGVETVLESVQHTLQTTASLYLLASLLMMVQILQKESIQTLETT